MGEVIQGILEFPEVQSQLFPHLYLLLLNGIFESVHLPLQLLHQQILLQVDFLHQKLLLSNLLLLMRLDILEVVYFLLQFHELVLRLLFEHLWPDVIVVLMQPEEDTLGANCFLVCETNELGDFLVVETEVNFLLD